jgi:hypothetical protein
MPFRETVGTPVVIRPVDLYYAAAHPPVASIFDALAR